MCKFPPGVRPFQLLEGDLHNSSLTLLCVTCSTSLHVYPWTYMSSLHRLLHTLPANRILAATICSSTYRRCGRTGLDATLDIPRGGPSFGLNATARESARAASRGPRVHFIIVLISALTATPHRRAGAPSILPRAVC